LADADRPCRFEPARATVRVGQTVRWVNAGDVFHTVTSTGSLDRREPSGRFDRSLAGRGESFEFRFDVPGTYAYYCRPHSEFMFGTVEVLG
jgi:plastocyanin